GKNNILLPRLANNFLVILIVYPAKISYLYPIATFRNIIIAAGCILPSRQWGIRGIFPIMLAVYMDPSARAFITRTIIYLKYLLGPLAFHGRFWLAFKRPTIVKIIGV